MKNLRILYKSLACSAIIWLFLTGGYRASGKQIVYEKIDVQMTLNRDTSIDIVEHQQVRLNGDWNGLYRYYELIGCDNIEILDVYENDTPYQKGSIDRKGGYILEREKGKLQVKWRSRNVEEPLYADAVTTFTIRYRVMGAIAQHRRRDVLFWKPLFHDTEHSIASAKVTLILPEVIDPNQTEVIFYTEAPFAEWEIDPQNRRSINFIAKEVYLKNKFEIKVSLPKGMLEHYSSAKNRYTYNIKPWILPFGILGTAVVLLVFWYILGRDPHPQPEQISDIDILAIPPGLAGLLVNESFDVQDITATIIDLARRGYLHIKEIKPKTHSESGCWEFQLLQVPEKEELREYEELLIQKLFSDSPVLGKKVNTNQLKNHFYQYIPEIEKQVWQEASNLKWFGISPRGIAGFFLLQGLLVILCSWIFVMIDNLKIILFIIAASVFGVGSGLALVL